MIQIPEDLNLIVPGSEKFDDYGVSIERLGYYFTPIKRKDGQDGEELPCLVEREDVITRSGLLAFASACGRTANLGSSIWRGIMPPVDLPIQDGDTLDQLQQRLRSDPSGAAKAWAGLTYTALDGGWTYKGYANLIHSGGVVPDVAPVRVRAAESAQLGGVGELGRILLADYLTVKGSTGILVPKTRRRNWKANGTRPSAT